MNILLFKRRVRDMFQGTSQLKYLYARACKRHAINERQILFESFHGKTISDSPLYMLREFLTWEEAKSFKIYYATNDIGAHKLLVKALGLPVTLVDVNTEEYTYALATSKYLVNNSSFPNYFIRRDDQRYIQTWHGTPIKTLGKRMRLGTESMYNVQHNFLQANVLTFPNGYTRSVVMRDYNLDALYTGDVALVGYPRNRVFMDGTGKAMRERLGLDGITCLAYMPTWRGISNHSVETDSYAAELFGILRTLDEALGEDERLYVNLHPMVAADIRIEGYKHVLPFPEGVDNYEFLAAMDGLITDYSSVFFDFSLTKRPVILFTYDYEKYMADRGVYFDVHELPFVQIDTLEGLRGVIQDGSWKGCDYSASSYARDYLAYDSAENPKACLDLLFGREPSGVPVESYAKNTQKRWHVIDPRTVNSIKRVEQLAQAVDPEHDLAVFDFSKFTSEMSAYLYDNYVDSFNYVFVRRAVPRTRVENVLQVVSKRVAARLEQRDRRRIFADLNIDPEITTKVFWDDPSTSPARVERLNARGKQRIRFTATVQKTDAYRPVGVQLRYRSEVEDIVVELPFTCTQKRNGSFVLKVDFKPSDYGCFKDIYWDAEVVLENGAERHEVPLRWKSSRLDLLRFTNTFAHINEQKILFPYGAKGRKLAFVCRDVNPYDTAAARAKELAAVAVYVLGRWHWRRKCVWLVYEKFCSLAQDNGYYFFQYCMEQLPPEERAHIFYVIDRNSPDYANVAKYGKNVLPFMSFRHILFTICAKIYIASDSKSHVYVWRPKPSFVAGVSRKKRILFLQHGVTAMKKVDPLFGKHGSSPMTYFLTTSKREQEVVVKHFGYNYEHAPVLGFSRWDAIVEKKTPGAPMILIMPTWRPWLEEQSAEAFAASEYCKRYTSLISSPKLEAFLERTNATVSFFIHPKLADQITAFRATSSRVRLVPQGSEPLNQLIMESSMLITDYSSVCWDVLFMNKPVVFYQFDQGMYLEITGSYIDLNTELPGQVCFEEGEVLHALDVVAEHDFTMSEQTQEKADEWFDARDANNRKRTVEFLLGRGYGIDDKEDADSSEKRFSDDDQ